MYKLIRFLWRLIPFKKTIFVFCIIIFVVPFFAPKQTVLGVPLLSIQEKVVAKMKELYLSITSDEALSEANLDKVWTILGYDLNSSKVEKVKELNKESAKNSKEKPDPASLSLAANKFGLNESDLLQQIYNKKDQLKQTLGQSKGPTRLGGGIPEVSASNLIFGGNNSKHDSSVNAVERYLSLSSSGQKISEVLKGRESVGSDLSRASNEVVPSNGDSKRENSVTNETPIHSNNINVVSVLNIKTEDYLKIDRFVLNKLDVWELNKLPEYKELKKLSLLIGIEEAVLKEYFDYHMFLYSDIRSSINKNSTNPQDFINLMKKNNWRLIDVKRATGWDDLSLLHYVVQME